MLFSLQSKINLELTYNAPAVSGTVGGADVDEDGVEGKGGIDKEEEKGGRVCSFCCHRRC